ncbi:MAG: FecR domain-containing protein [Bacteroidota bacterium]
MPVYDRDERFLARWLNGELTEAEREAFERSDDYKEFQAIAENAKDLAPSPYDKKAGWEALDKLTTQKPSAKVRRLIPWRAIAASVALVILGTVGWYWTGQRTITAATAQQELVNLPDGSQVVLNSKSTLAYNSRLWSWKRRLDLTGEAFFEVTSGENFSVSTPQGKVEVLGTSFNVYSRGTTFEVHCLSGKVAVQASKQGERLQLAPNEVLRMNNGRGSPASFTAEDGPRWQEGENRYTSVSLARVMDDLGFQFGLKFDLSEVDATQQFTGAFLHEDVDQALDMVLAPMDLRYVRKGDQVRLFTKD